MQAATAPSLASLTDALSQVCFLDEHFITFFPRHTHLRARGPLLCNGNYGPPWEDGFANLSCFQPVESKGNYTGDEEGDDCGGPSV